MARFIPDINTKRWVVITPQRAKRPDVVKNKHNPYSTEIINGFNFHVNCPFCLGNEQLTPPEVYRWGKRGKLPAIRINSRGDRRYKKEAVLWLLGLSTKSS